MRNYFPKRPSGSPLHTLSKFLNVSVGFVTLPLIRGSVLLYLQSPKGGCCSISDNLSCSFNHLTVSFIQERMPTCTGETTGRWCDMTVIRIQPVSWWTTARSLVHLGIFFRDSVLFFVFQKHFLYFALSDCKSGLL